MIELDHGDRSVCSVSFSPCGTRVLTGCGDGDGDAWVFDAELDDGAEEAAGRSDGPSRVVEPTVVTCCSSSCFPVPGPRPPPEVPYRSRRGAAVAAVLRFLDHHGQGGGRSMYTTALAFSPCGTRILTGCADGKARVFDAAERRPSRPGAAREAALLLELDHGARAVYSVAFSPCGTRILTGCVDGLARVFEAPALASASSPPSPPGGAGAALAPAVLAPVAFPVCWSTAGTWCTALPFPHAARGSSPAAWT